MFLNSKHNYFNKGDLNTQNKNIYKKQNNAKKKQQQKKTTTKKQT